MTQREFVRSGSVVDAVCVLVRAIDALATVGRAVLAEREACAREVAITRQACELGFVKGLTAEQVKAAADGLACAERVIRARGGQ